jgi:hypothetical protein
VPRPRQCRLEGELVVESEGARFGDDPRFRPRRDDFSGDGAESGAGRQAEQKARRLPRHRVDIGSYLDPGRGQFGPAPGEHVVAQNPPAALDEVASDGPAHDPEPDDADCPLHTRSRSTT